MIQVGGHERQKVVELLADDRRGLWMDTEAWERAGESGHPLFIDLSEL
jgi:hypothetical protein